jgi:3D (Asp-Asp-Asp) domain-containing protein
MPREGLFHWEVTNMSTHIRTWGIALTAMVAFAVPHLATQAETTAMVASTVQAPVTQTAPAVQKTLNLKVTAYTSLEDETDDTPFITADGSYVHDGVVATNLLPFGTKVMIPSLFGDKLFTVNDRMSKRLMNNIDVWMGTKAAAIVFGAHTAKVVVLQDSTSTVAEITANQVMAINSKAQGPSVRQL